MKNNKSHAKNEKGFALVIAMLFSLMLLMLGTALMYSMTSFFKALAVSGQRSQNYYIATSGVEKAKDYMWSPNDPNYPRGCNPANGWCDRIGNLGQPADPSFRDISDKIDFDSFGAPAGFKVYIRDNDDGDNNYTMDDDTIIIAVASGNDGSGGQTSVEAMLMFTASQSNNAQLGGAADKEGRTTSGITTADLSTIRQGGK